MEESKITNKELIKKNEERFNLYFTLPGIIATLFGIVCTIIGIVLAVLFEDGIFVMIIIGGIVLACLLYYMLKGLFSYHILHICYLRKILNQTEKKETTKVKTPIVDKLQKTNESQSSVTPDQNSENQ